MAESIFTHRFNFSYPYFGLLFWEIWHKGLHLYGNAFFIAFEFFQVIAHFVAEKRFFNMHSATLLNKTFEVRILKPSLFAWSFQLKSLKWIPTFNLFFEAIPPSYRTKHSRRHEWLTVEKKLIPHPNSHWKYLKNIYLKYFLPEWYVFLCTFCSKFGWYIIYLQFTKI